MDSAAEKVLPDTAHDAKVKFLEGYEVRMELWEKLASFVESELKLLINEDPPVSAVYSHRVKSRQSLTGKIEKQQASGDCLTLESIQQRRWDIAATRICLYFPCQSKQVRKFIELHKLFEVLPDTSGQSAKPFRGRLYVPKDQEYRPYEERTGFYEADHYWIRLRRDIVQEQIPGYDGEEVEIQVRTMLMDAWAEVRHDLDYKHILGYPGEDELRVLDAIRGSITACEIMQDQLFVLRQQRLENDNVLFTSWSTNPHFWRAVNSSLRPRHGFLLRKYGDEPLSTPRSFLQETTFSGVEIKTPLDLKKRMAELVMSHNVPPTQSLLAYNMETAEKLLASVVEVMQREKKNNYVEWISCSIASVSSFLSVFLFSKMPEAAIRIFLRKNIHANRNLCIETLRIVLFMLQKDLCSGSQQDKKLRVQTFSVIWHIREWGEMSTTDSSDRSTIPVFSRLLGHLQQYSVVTPSWTALWSISAAVYVYYHCRQPGDTYPYLRDSRHVDEDLSQECFDHDAWRDGEHVAADIIGIGMLEVRRKLLHEILCYGWEKEKYHTLYCLRNEDFIKKMLPEGLSLLHYSVIAGNTEMVRHLTSIPDFDVRATWLSGREVPTAIVGCFPFTLYRVFVSLERWIELDEAVIPWTALRLAEQLIRKRYGKFLFDSDIVRWKECAELLRERMARDAEYTVEG
jgi:ppGpp synthetase/RelA/SpoT-type nucleotidyltranferase